MNNSNRTLLKLPWDTEAILRDRPNRYLALVDLPTQPGVKAHVHDPGRLTELLYPGNKVLLKHVPAAHRKTEWDVLAARHADQWVLVHSGHHRKIADALLNRPDLSPFPAPARLRAEVRHQESRIDFLLENPGGEKTWIEVKGCTLAVDKIALFPDAPTVRGSKHLQTLINLRASGQDAAILILIFRRDAECFRSHHETDPAFAEHFQQARRVGVAVHPVVLEYTDGEIRFVRPIDVCR